MARRIKQTPLEELRDRDPSVGHPLRVFLVRRGVKLEEAAVIFGWSLRKLKDVIGKDHYPGDEDLAEKARQLGFDDVEAIFPTRDEHGYLIGQNAANARIRRSREYSAREAANAASSKEGARTKTKK